MTNFLHSLLDFLTSLTLVEASLLLLAENLIVFLLAVATGSLMLKLFPLRRVAHAPERTEPMEVVLTISTILLNTVVTILGWWLWKIGIITFRTDTGFRALILDPLLLLLVMDLAMYGLHRLAHWNRLYPFLHKTHHRYDRPHPLTLFVLNPFEAIAFGGLWLVVVALYDWSWIGMSIYLALNVLFGVIGHLGVEPFPDRWKSLPVVQWISTSTFHARHHQDKGYNFGFYTLLWDRLFGTLSPGYDRDFGRMPGEQGS